MILSTIAVDKLVDMWIIVIKFKKF